MDTDKIKGFFAHHVEKMILVVVIGLSGFLIYKGFEKPDFTDEHQPDVLSQNATQVRSDVDLDHNEAVLKEDIESTASFDIVQETERLYTSVDSSLYRLDRTWEGKSLESIVRRKDPVLVSPSSIVLDSIVTAIATRAKTTSPEPAYALAQLENADELEKVETRKRRSRGSRRRGGADDGMEGMMGEMEGMMGGMEGMMGGMNEDEGMGEMEGMMGGMEGMMSGGMGGMGGITGGPGRRFADDLGFRPTKTADNRLPEPSLARFIVGTALVPHKEIYANFELALADAAEYSTSRDTPFYVGFEVQRADVTDKPVDQLADEDWQTIWDRAKYTNVAAKFWSGFAPEIVHEEYRDNALTMWLPPVLLDDYRPWARHPMIPEKSRKELKAAASQNTEDETFEEFNIDDNSELLDPGKRSNGNSMSEMFSGGMEGGMEMGDMGGMDGMDGMMMGMMMGMSGRGVDPDPVEHKMVRFYDFARFRNGPKPGRTYVYRIRYGVVDPNFPLSELQQPRTKNLAPEVATRVQGLMQKAVANDSRKGLFERWSDWSEPSAPMSLPSLSQVFAGPVERGNITMTNVGGKQVEYARNEPTAKVVASQYDPRTGARIPVELDVVEGAVLSKQLESADVVDPISLLVKKMPNASVVSGTTVIDIDGAKPLKIAEDTFSPGMILLFDQSGQLVVHEEADDQEQYRAYSYAEERGIE